MKVSHENIIISGEFGATLSARLTGKKNNPEWFPTKYCGALPMNFVGRKRTSSENDVH